MEKGRTSMCGGQGLRFNAYATVYRFSAALKIGSEADLPQNEDLVQSR